LPAAPKRHKPKGRPPQKGRKLPTPQQVVAQRARTESTVSWYGGGNRRVGLVTNTGRWYKAGAGVVPLRWVFVHDLQGTHRDEYFYTTDPALTAEQIVSWFTARWPIETTFQELRAHLGFETTRQHVALRCCEPPPVCWACQCDLSDLCPARPVASKGYRQTLWYVKDEPTFSDAIATVRRLFWREILLHSLRIGSSFTNYPETQNLGCSTGFVKPPDLSELAEVELRGGLKPAPTTPVPTTPVPTDICAIPNDIDCPKSFAPSEHFLPPDQ